MRRSLGIIFETATPVDRPFKMAELVEWFNMEWEKREFHRLLLIAIFLVHFLASHPPVSGWEWKVVTYIDKLTLFSWLQPAHLVLV